MNHMLHIAAATQIRLDTEGRAYYRRKRTEARPAWKPCGASSDGSPMRSTDGCSPTRTPRPMHTCRAAPMTLARAREGTAGRLVNPAWSTFPRTSTLRISHFPDPRARRYNQTRDLGRPRPNDVSTEQVDKRGEPD
jgi:hypothetical protein